MRLERLAKRKDFLRLSAQGHKFITPSFILLAAPAPVESTPDIARFGFTVTKKLGNAVIRNRIRRRLREAVRLGASEHAQAGWDYVLIARNNALQSAFSTLLRELHFALPRVITAEINAPRPPRRTSRK